MIFWKVGSIGKMFSGVLRAAARTHVAGVNSERLAVIQNHITILCTVWLTGIAGCLSLMRYSLYRVLLPVSSFSRLPLVSFTPARINQSIHPSRRRSFRPSVRPTVSLFIHSVVPSSSSWRDALSKDDSPNAQSKRDTSERSRF